ncbi:hypothetical protein [Kitasatospora sp. NPDC088548]|uniref:hypothetical protein n=1 Tax=Kitasatospora sp. NPDC088548 TaxID=3364075 RepID=UPI0037F61627
MNTTNPSATPTQAAATDGPATTEQEAVQGRGAIAPEDIRPGDTIEALNTSGSNPQPFSLTVDRTPWRVNSTTTALTDGASMYDAQTASLRLISRPSGR